MYLLPIALEMAIQANIILRSERRKLDYSPRWSYNL